MKATTNVWVAIRNIGDSQDRGQTFNGTVSESVLWLAQQLSKLTLAGRIVMGLGRTESDALKGIDVKNAGKTAITDDMEAMLRSVFDSDEDDTQESAPENPSTQPRIAGDDYVA